MTILSSTVIHVRRYKWRGQQTDVSSSSMHENVVLFRYRDRGVLEKMKAYYNVVETNALKDAIASSIGERLLEETKKEASRFKDTGALIDSLELRQMGAGRFAVDSDSVYKATWIQDESQGIPPIHRLQEWMSHKASFTGMGPKTKLRIAFAIQRSFITGEGAGSTGLSTLRSLNNEQRRMYDYPRIALENIQSEIDQLGQIFRELS
jgi:hypothetical protein